MQCKENILKSGVGKRVKICVFQLKTGQISAKVKDRAKFVIDH